MSLPEPVEYLSLLFRVLGGGKPSTGRGWKAARDDVHSRVRKHFGVMGSDLELLRCWIESALESETSFDPDEAAYLRYLADPETEGSVIESRSGGGKVALQSVALDRLAQDRGWTASQIGTQRNKLASGSVPRKVALLLAEELTMEPAAVSGHLGSGTVIFAYGSLLSPKSLGETLARPVKADEYIAATLAHYRLAWGVPVRNTNLVESDSLRVDEELRWLALVLESARGGSVTGGLIAVTDTELARLQEREARYELRTVTSDIREANGLGERSVFAFIPAEQLTEIVGSAAVREGYLHLVAKARKDMGLSDLLPQAPSVVDATDPDALVRAGGWPKGRNGMTWTQTVEGFMRERNCYRTTHRAQTAPTLPRPLLISHFTFDQITQAAQQAVAGACKQLKTVLADPSLTAEYGIAYEEAECARPFIDKQPLPEVARVDLVAHCGKVQVLEVNADSPAGLHHFSALADVVNSWWPHIHDQQIDTLEQDPMNQAVIAIGQAQPDHHTLRTAAIVERDPSSWPSYDEMKAFRDIMERRWNCKVLIADPEDLTLSSTGELLHNHRTPIQLVYKRALWRDLQNEGGQALLTAGANGTVGIANSLFGRLSGNKRLLADLSRSGSEGFFPETYVAAKSETDLREEVRRNPDDWVLKGFRGFGGKEFLAAEVGHNQANWRQEVDDIFDQDSPTHIVQRRQQHGHFTIETEHPRTVSRMKAIFGAYVIAGKCVGIEAKLGNELPISMNNRGVRAVVGTVRPAT